MKRFRIYYEHENWINDIIIKANSKEEVKYLFVDNYSNCNIKLIIEI